MNDPSSLSSLKNRPFPAEGRIFREGAFHTYRPPTTPTRQGICHPFEDGGDFIDPPFHSLFTILFHGHQLRSMQHEERLRGRLEILSVPLGTIRSLTPFSVFRGRGMSLSFSEKGVD